jgi:serine protease AprX
MSLRLVPHALALAIASAFAAGPAAADASIPNDLAQRIATALPLERLEVVVTYRQEGPADASDLAALRALGILSGVRLEALPAVGVLATPAQIRALARRSDVASVYPNRTLRYYNADSRELSGVAYAQSHPQDFGRTTPFRGAGVTVMVNDSGIDATHADLAFGDHVVENVQALLNVGSVAGFLPPLLLEGQPNTDLASGHGTHCAGTVGGTGARSGGGYAGVAPEADLVGYGSGAAISILDALGGFDYAIAHQDDFASPIRVISNSWGSEGDFDPNDPINLASYEAYKRGMVVVFAAGNGGPGADTHNPYAQAPWVISVAAADKTMALADFSSRGNPGEGGAFTTADGVGWTWSNAPTITATGVDVISTRALTNLVANGATADLGPIPLAQLPYYTMISGTSMATPHVAGIAALLLEADPTLTPAGVRALLTGTATPMAGRAAWEVGAGHVNAYQALLQATGH